MQSLLGHLFHRRVWQLVLLAGISASIALSVAGCGSSENALVETTRPLLTPETGGGQLALTSPALKDNGIISTGYRCDPRSIWLPIEWSKPPQETAELVLIISVTNPLDGSSTEDEGLRAKWIIAGIKPDSRRLLFGQLPPSAFILPVSADSHCPLSGQSVGIVVHLFAMPGVHIREEFETVDPADIAGFSRIALASDQLSGMYTNG